MTTPASWKDQLTDLGFETTCEDIRYGGGLTVLHTSTSECAITIIANGSVCGGDFTTLPGGQVYVSFDVTFNNAVACPPFTPPDTIDDVLSCSHSIYATSEISTYTDLLQNRRKFRVWVIAGTQFPICNSITLTAENTCGDVGIGVWKPSCQNQECLNCTQLAFNIPDLAFSHDQTWTNPYSYASWLAGTAPGSNSTQQGWLGTYRVKQTISGPGRFVGIKKIRGQCPTGLPTPIDYGVDVTYLIEATGVRWWNGSPYTIDEKYTISGRGFLRFGGNNASYLGGFNIVNLYLLRNDYPHFRKIWVPSAGALVPQTSTWSGCWTSLPGPPGPCGEITNANVWKIADSVGNPADPVSTCMSEAGNEVTVNMNWRGVNYDPFTGTFSGSPGFVMQAQTVGGFLITPFQMYAPNLSDVWIISSIPTPCGTAKTKFVTC